MGDTIEDMDIEIEQKVNKIDFLENKIGLPGCKIIEQMNKLGLNKISSKKRPRILDRLINSLNNHKYIKNKKVMKVKLLMKRSALIFICL